MTWFLLLKNWRIVLLVLSLSASLLLVNHWRLKANELDVVKKDLSSCVASAKLTKELNDGLQKSRDSINSRLIELKRLHGNSCVSIRPDTIESGQEHAGLGGRVAGTSDQFRKYFAVCETFRVERIALEQLLNAN